MNEEGKDIYDILMEKSLLELRKIYASGMYGDERGVDNRKLNKLKLVIGEKEREEERNKFERIVAISKNNANATDKLVIATWSLVVVTVLLVLVSFIRTSPNGKYQFISRSDWGETTGTIVMDTHDATIYHIKLGSLESFNPLTARRKQWSIDEKGKFKKIHDGF